MTKPLLPTTERLIPYLERIDVNRTYSNFGPLNAEYQDRLSSLFEAPCITGSSATSLITATLMAYDLPGGSFVAMPSWTFPATAAAVVNAGLVPYFVDVDDSGHSYMLQMLKVSARIVVAPLGSSIDMSAWSSYSKSMSLPVIIDAAAGFDAFSTICKPDTTPVIISTHATKSFGTGEGGFVTCHDIGLLERVRRITNFGLSPDRRIEYNGLNAKFSEYHAAVGLAELDGWPDKRSRYIKAVKPYGLDYAVAQVAVRGGDGKKGVYGCHQHNAYKNYPRAHLPVTEDLIESMRFVGIDI